MKEILKIAICGIIMFVVGSFFTSKKISEFYKLKINQKNKIITTLKRKNIVDKNLSEQNRILQEKVEQYEKQESLCLKKNIYFESRGEPYLGQLAVGFVTLNRVNSPKFPNTICEVVKQKKQFSWYWDGKSDNIYDFTGWVKAVKVANDVMYGNYKDPTNGALFYHANYVKPYWQKHFKQTKKIYKHIFYR